jgi:hypothetical protein
MNSNNKPEAITISGSITNNDAIAEIIYELIKQKLKQGYRHYSGQQVETMIHPTGVDYIKQQIEFNVHFKQYGETTYTVFDAIYKMNSLYFRAQVIFYEYKKEKVTSLYGSIENSFQLPEYIKEYSFYIENGDNNRKGGSNATKFDF